ncbi:polymorphic toxin type 44 domain-containing protein [Pseudomonas sp. DTU_2021_1001937_2_SI_NGA_ILE_001]|uniref:polymorphic toxin type 44 domain-containing protein n=1 Tax=Pseudomonas sp. DTU_2021_1001937_2_SI_NGA_ILE_001 TaxID=3077589 RepID=UPI0028FC311C|nr:polymorphic toxin type 44 domain-containing protein [Pseudomonas sp. DTU_2021_1001937_2_SI_NGA_ILE_001]WNW11209.1 polymorphic toxin type 44 domain-containing protein [Pseudomonas sp. DTU_2021_1001937_2_SI_NGA_ILE_001]
MSRAREQRNYFSRGGSAFLLSWFYTQVRNRGPWDFKQQGAQYENFGNFHYGAVGTAAGIGKELLLRAAGAAQSRAGTHRDEFGSWWSSAPFGDDPKDQHWISKGIEYAETMGY